MIELLSCALLGEGPATFAQVKVLAHYGVVMLNASGSL